MKCPKCSAEMQRVGMEELVGAQVFVTLECPACHCRAQQPAQKPHASL